MQSTSIQTLLERMNSGDKDFRFMATNDLMGELQHDNIRMDDESETKVTNQIVTLLGDKNGEVQNVAVRCLGYLVSKIKDDRRQLVIKSLCLMLKNENEQIRDIASIALKTIVPEIPINKRMIDIVNNDLNPNLLNAIANSKDVNVQLESLEILTELINRLGPQLAAYHERMQQELMSQLDSERSAVRKRSMNALSYLLVCCSDDLFGQTFSQLLNTLQELSTHCPSNLPNSTVCCTKAKTLLQCIATIVRISGHRSTIEQINQIIPVIHNYCLINEDELRENCLQAFEAYIRRCPVNICASLPSIIDVCLTSIKHDPNYNYDEDDTDDEAMDTDGDDDVSDSAEDYSDDDDLSWKVRRASAKCLEAIVVSRGDMIGDFFVAMAPTLISRFKEREESVKADIIQTFVMILKQVRHYPASQSLLNELKEMIPSIVNKSSNLLREKSVKTRQTVFQLFIELVNILPNALSNNIASLVPGILYSLVDKNSSSNMKIDALIFVQELVKTHQPETFYPQIHVMLPAVITAVSDSFYKIASEAISLLSQLVCVIRPMNGKPMQGYEPILSTIYEKTLERMSKTDVDQEIKKKAITCMGQIIASFGDLMPNELPVALRLLHEKLNNDSLRLTCIKALTKIATSPLDISLNNIFPSAFSTISSYLRKNSRPLKISILILIENVVRRSVDLLDSESAQSVILNDIPSLITENDLYVSQLALAMLTTIIKTHKAFHPIVPQQVLPEVLKLIRSPLLQGSALYAVLQFLSIIVTSSFPGLGHKALYEKLVEPIYNGMPNVHKQAFNSTAKAIAAISYGDDSRTLMTANQLISDLKRHSDADPKYDQIYTLILLSLGELGKLTNLEGVPELTDVILQAFNSSSEDVKSAGSFALGSVAVGNMDKFLPVILEEITSRSKRQYLILHSLREVIACGKLEQLEVIWKLLMTHCECQEEGTRNVVSECLGKLVLLRPELLERLIKYLKNDCSDKPSARSSIIASIKFAICDQPHEIDEVLRNCIGEFLAALQDSDINVRRTALITFNSAAHNKPSLIIRLLPKLLPLLYKETLVKPELIREVEMGPFKHQVDDGLDTRKAAYECMYTLLDHCQNHLDIFEFLTHVENGLKDHYDIKMLTYLMLNKLADLCPTAVLQRMDRLLYPIEDVCRTKPKENAVKQEHEKQDELKRSALRAFDALRSVPNAERHPVLVRFFEDFLQGDKDLSSLYASIHREATVSNDFSTQRMDVS